MSFCNHVDLDEQDILEKRLDAKSDTSNSHNASTNSNTGSPIPTSSSPPGGVGGEKSLPHTSSNNRKMRSIESGPLSPGGSSLLMMDYLEMNSSFTMQMKPLSEQIQLMNAEYQKLEATTQDPRKVNFTTSVAMMELNRYSNIAANEDTIFPPLPKGLKNPQTDPSFLYINGNLMNLGQDRQFVASQAPIPQGFQHFFATLIRYRISFIIMLTKEIENESMKAHPYWPSENSSESKPQKCGRFALWRDTQTTPNYIEDKDLKLIFRSFCIQELRDSTCEMMRRVGGKNVLSTTSASCGTGEKGDHPPVHKVHLIQYVGWPDHGVPSSANAFQYLLKKIEAHTESTPILVHCSAGVGRTATLIGCYAGMHRIRRGEFTDKTVPELVTQMRRARFGSVQRVEQYMFMYQTLMSFMGIDTTELSKEISKRAADFQSLMNRMRRY